MPLSQPKNIADITMDIQVTEYAIGGELIDPKETKGRLSCAKIHLPANRGFERHIHPSDHLLIILEGDGFLTYWEEGAELRMDFKTGDVVPMPMELHHAVTAGSNGTTLLAIGTPARTLHDPERMKFV
jgi:quercetin dioxygenase-like cupin family protein